MEGGEHGSTAGPGALRLCMSGFRGHPSQACSALVSDLHSAIQACLEYICLF